MGWLIVDGHEDIATALLEAKDRDFGVPAPPGQALSLADAKRGGVGRHPRARSSPPRATGRARARREAAERQMRCYEDLLAEAREGPLPPREPGRPLAVPRGRADRPAAPDGGRRPRALRRASSRAGWSAACASSGSRGTRRNRYSGGTKDDLGVTREGARAARRDARAGRDPRPLAPERARVRRRDGPRRRPGRREPQQRARAPPAPAQPHGRADPRPSPHATGSWASSSTTRSSPTGRPRSTPCCAHIDHIVELVGPDHVGHRQRPRRRLQHEGRAAGHRDGRRPPPHRRGARRARHARRRPSRRSSAATGCACCGGRCRSRDGRRGPVGGSRGARARGCRRGRDARPARGRDADRGRTRALPAIRWRCIAPGRPPPLGPRRRLPIPTLPP